MSLIQNDTTNNSVKFEDGRHVSFKGHTKKVHSVAWNCTGSFLASGSLDHTAKATPLTKGAPNPNMSTPIELKGHANSVLQLCWSPANPSLLATASQDKSVRVWDIIARKMLKRLELLGENININWSTNGKFIAVGDKSDHISFIRVGQEIEKDAVLHFRTELNEMAFSADSKKFFVAQGNGIVSIFEVKDEPGKLVELKHCTKLKAHTGQCYCIAFSPCFRFFATGGADATVTLWSTRDLICLRVFNKQESAVRTVSFSHDSKFLASGSEDNLIDITHVHTGEHVHSMNVKAALNSVAWHPCEYILAYATDDSTRASSSSDPGALRLFVPSSIH